MKKITGILLIGFLGFLGCSDGNDGTTTVGQANPVAPWAIIETPTPTYEWTPVPGATKYRLVVSESSQASSPQDKTEATTIQDAQETYIIDDWYTAEEAVCASEDSLCMVTPDIEVFEEYTWMVQACANEECGAWTEETGFRVTPPGSAGAPRFIDNGDHTITDTANGLMWNQYGNIVGDLDSKWSGGMNCDLANDFFDNRKFFGYSDWRIPTINELRSIYPELYNAQMSDYTGVFTLHNKDRFWPFNPGITDGDGWVLDLDVGWYKLRCHEYYGHGNGTFVFPVRFVCCGGDGQPPCNDPYVGCD